MITNRPSTSNLLYYNSQEIRDNTPVRGKSPGTSVLAINQNTLLDIADAIHTPPASIDTDYLGRCERAAAFLKNPVTAPPIPVPAPSKQSYVSPPSSGGSSAFQSILSIVGEQIRHVTSLVMPQGYSRPYGSVHVPANSTSDTSVVRNAVSAARNNVFDVMNRVSAFISKAINNGYKPPANPFVTIASMNASRIALSPINVSDSRATQILHDIIAYLDLLQAEEEGVLNLSTHTFNTAQLSSATISLLGYGGSGDTATDLLQFLPDMDAIKQEQARQALSVLDFTKRIPEIIFTAGYNPDSTSTKGVILGWKKIPDASGYVVRRRNIFDGSIDTFTFTNDDIESRMRQIRDYVQTYVLTFYDNIGITNICAFVDTTAAAHCYYTYTVQAYQVFNELKNTIFAVQTSPAHLTPAQQADVKKQLNMLDPENGYNSISPYPILAQVLLGNSAYDWILAGVNVRDSISRNDTRDVTRKYSYLTAQMDFLLDQMSKGLFKIPKGASVDPVIQNVTDSVSKYGVVQTIQEIMQENGILYYFDGADPQENTYFNRLNVVDQTKSNIVQLVSAAIDPETATLNLFSLASNLPSLLQGLVGVSESLVPGSQKPTPAGPTEIQITPSVQNDVQSNIQFLQVPDTLPVAVDLTTFDGISVFIRTIRIYSDIGPGAAAPVVVADQSKVADPVPPPPAAVPPPSNPSPQVIPTSTTPSTPTKPVDQVFKVVQGITGTSKYNP